MGYKIHKIRLGTQQVRPYKYEYSYDFRNKSSTILTNDGWSYTNTPLFDANGMYYSTWNSVLDKTISQIGTFNKVILKSTFSTVYANTFAIACYLVDSNKSNQYGLYADNGNSTPYLLKIGGTDVYSGARLSDGEHLFVLELDLSSKTYSCTSPVSKSGSLTDAQITALRQYKNIRLLVAQPGIRFKTLSVMYE